MTGYTLPKALILKKSEQFREIIQNGTCLQSECFVVYYVAQQQLEIGFTVTKKAINKPLRNRLKRVTREAVRQCYREYDLKAGIVVIANLNAMTASHEKILLEIKRLLFEIDRCSRECNV